VSLGGKRDEQVRVRPLGHPIPPPRAAHGLRRKKSGRVTAKATRPPTAAPPTTLTNKTRSRPLAAVAAARR
jgi:hypothetical protein